MHRLDLYSMFFSGFDATMYPQQIPLSGFVRAARMNPPSAVGLPSSFNELTQVTLTLIPANLPTSLHLLVSSKLRRDAQASERGYVRVAR